MAAMYFPLELSKFVMDEMQILHPIAEPAQCGIVGLAFVNGEMVPVTIVDGFAVKVIEPEYKPDQAIDDIMSVTKGMLR